MFNGLGRPHCWTHYSGNAEFVKNRLECGSNSFRCIIDGSLHKYHFYRDESFVAANTCLYVSVATNTCLTQHKMSFVAKKSMLTYFCWDETFVATNMCRVKHNFTFLTLICVCRDKRRVLSREKVCLSRQKHNFVPTKVLSRQSYFCRDKNDTYGSSRK